MRTWVCVLAAFLLPIAGGVASALQPCPASCHLGQGQPVLLADLDAVLMTRCDRKKAASGASYTCVTEQLSFEGKVVKTLPRPRSTGPDHEFTTAHLEGHTVVQLGWQEKWSALDKPYVLNELFSRQLLTLTLGKSTLRCVAPGLPTVTRDFGCVPAEVHVFATMGFDTPPRRPVIVVGVCHPDAESEREVVVVCTAAESPKKKS